MKRGFMETIKNPRGCLCNFKNLMRCLFFFSRKNFILKTHLKEDGTDTTKQNNSLRKLKSDILNAFTTEMVCKGKAPF